MSYVIGMRVRCLLVVLGVLILHSTARAQATFPNLESCALDFWGNVKATQDLSLDVPLAKVDSENKEVISEIIKKEGLAHAYMTLHLIYARCIEKTGINTKSPGLAATDPYWKCAYQSATRFAILVRIEKDATIAQQKASMPAEYHGLIDVLYRQSEKSFLNAAVFSAQGGKDCVARALKEKR